MSTLSLSTAAELLRLAAEHPDLDLADDAEEAMPLTATMRGLRDLAEMATERCAALIKGVREARKDGHVDAAEYDELDAQAMAALADIAAVRAEIARGRAALKASEDGR